MFNLKCPLVKIYGYEKVKIGLLGTGLDTYWNQFEGLHDALLAYQEKICSKMEVVNDVEVVNVGLVDNAQKSIEAADKLVSEGVDIVFLYMSTYCLSSTVLPIAQRVNCPIIILNLQPTSAVDYDYMNSLQDRGKIDRLLVDELSGMLCSGNYFCFEESRFAL